MFRVILSPLFVVAFGMSCSAQIRVSVDDQLKSYKKTVASMEQELIERRKKLNFEYIESRIRTRSLLIQGLEAEKALAMNGGDLDIAISIRDRIEKLKADKITTPSPPPVATEKQIPVDTRTVWQFAKLNRRLVSKGTGIWIEGGESVWHEKFRKDEYISLYDEGRDYSGRIYKTSFIYQSPEHEELGVWKIREGAWVRPTGAK